MFERYTQRARKVIYWARHVASELASDSIRPEHLLLGLIREQPDLFRPWLKTDEELQAINQELRHAHPASIGALEGSDMPLDPATRRVLAYAEEEAERQNTGQIRSSHLLAGLLREDGTPANDALRKRGVEIGKVRMTFVASLRSTDSAHRPETAELHRLVEELPPGQLAHARALLEALRAMGDRSGVSGAAAFE